MSTRRPEADHDGILAALAPMGRALRPSTTPSDPQSSTVYPVPPSRRHRRAVTTWQDEAAIQLLKQLALEQGSTQQALIAEGLNLVFAKHGKPQVAS